MTSDSKTRLLDDPLDDLRESKRMKNLPDPSEHIRSALDDPRRAPTDASEGVFGGTGGSPSVASTHDVMEKHAKSIKRSTSAGYAKSGKGKQKSERRNRRGTRDSEPAVKEEGPKAIRLPKRQCALLIGFCGSGYSGMQIQPDHARTIEGVLFQSMVRAGAVSQDNADDPVKISLARAARTDAGVHAAGNLVSLKMIMNVPGVSDMVTRINDELPPEIRLWGYVRVQNSFNARLICDSRKYTYFFPLYMLIPPKPKSGLHRTLEQYAGSLVLAADESGLKPHSFWAHSDFPTKESELAEKRTWRVEPIQVEQLRAMARKFEGTHNFHNFTVARDFNDRSNQRHMKKIEISDPVVYGQTEWISVLFHGQSFMLHQIRKMVSILVLACRTNTPAHIIEELYGPRAVFIPKMPALGLLLEEPIFDSYNTRMAVINEKLQPSDPDYRPPISFDNHREAINAFKQKFIYNNMREVEDRDGLFDAWIRAVDSYTGNDLLYLNSKGTIPPAAVIRKGERRENPFKEKKRFDATSFSVDDRAKSIDEDEDETPINKEDLADTEG